MIKDEQGKMVTNLDNMAKVMLDYLSLNIGKEDFFNEEVLVAQECILAFVKRRLLEAEAKFLERHLSKLKNANRCFLQNERG